MQHNSRQPHIENKKETETPTGTLTITLPACQEVVTVQPLTVGQIEQLTAHKEQPTRTLKTILMDCIQTPNTLDLDTLLACDCNALILAMRRATFGNDCDFIAPCQACGKQDTYTVNLSYLQTYPGDREIVQRQLDDPQATHPFTFLQCKRKALFRLCTGKQLFDGSPQQMPRQHNTGPLLHALLQRLCEVEGLHDTGMPLKVFVRDKLSAGDAADFLEMYKQVEPGYDDEVQLTCPHCQASFEHTLALEASHFFQRSQRKKRYGKRS